MKPGNAASRVAYDPFFLTAQFGMSLPEDNHED